jgi:cobalamin synthase
LLWKPERSARVDDRRYLRDVTIGLVVYLLLMLLVWPQTMHLTSMWLRAVVALLPVLPLAWMIRALLRVVLGGDELERRNHLQALAVAAGVVGLCSLALGLLALAKVIGFSAVALVMVAPALLLVHATAWLWLRRRYRDA